MSDFTVLCIGVDGWIRHWVVICDTHWVLYGTAGRNELCTADRNNSGRAGFCTIYFTCNKPLQVRGLNCTGNKNLVW